MLDVERPQQARDEQEHRVPRDVTPRADAAAEAECSSMHVEVFRSALQPAFRAELERVGKGALVDGHGPVQADDRRALGDAVAHVRVFFRRGMRDAPGRDGAPAQGLLDDGVDVRQSVPVFESWQAVGADDGVEFALGFGDEGWVGQTREDEHAHLHGRRVERGVGEDPDVVGQLERRHLLGFLGVGELLAPVPRLARQPGLQVARVQRLLELEELLRGALPRRQRRGEAVQDGNGVHDPGAHAGSVGEVVLHAVGVLEHLLVARAQAEAVGEGVDEARGVAFKHLLEVVRGEKVVQDLLALQVLQGTVGAGGAGAQRGRLHALVEPVAIVVASEEQVHALGEILAGHDHARPVAVDAPSLVEELLGDRGVRDHDHGVAAELGAEDRSVFLAPFVEGKPGELLRRLVEIADEREATGARW